MERLPRPAPAEPLPFAEQWLAEAAARDTKNPWAMALATASAEGRPSVRFVLLKSLSMTGGFIVFYTNYGSRKAIELDANAAAAGAIYWPEAGRQLRFEGRIERSPAAESDAYFATRPRLSQLNAWASEQSRPIAAPEEMSERLAARADEFAGTAGVPRPPGWGGYRLHLEAVEFWLEGTDRFHERLRYEAGPGGGWLSTWLQP